MKEEKKGKKLQYYHKRSKLKSARRQIKSRFFLSFGSSGLNRRFSAFCSTVPESSNVGLLGSPRLVMQLCTPSRHFFLPAPDFLVFPQPGFYSFSLLLTLLRKAWISRDVTISGLNLGNWFSFLLSERKQRIMGHNRFWRSGFLCSVNTSLTGWSSAPDGQDWVGLAANWKTGAFYLSLHTLLLTRQQT